MIKPIALMCIFIFVLSAFSQNEVPVDPFKIQEDAFKMIRKNIFERTSHSIQEECRQWKENYIKDFGKGSFEQLIRSYTESYEFKRLSKLAMKKQGTEDAKALKSRIDLLLYRALESFERYRELKNESLRYDRERSTIRQIFLKRRFNDSRNEYFEFLRILREYNQLVEKYNSVYLGCEEFIKETNFLYREKRL